MSRETCAGAVAAGLVVVESGDDLEGVKPSVGSVAHIDDPSVEGMGQFGIFIFGVKDKDLGIFRSHIGKQGFCGIRFT